VSDTQDSCLWKGENAPSVLFNTQDISLDRNGWRSAVTLKVRPKAFGADPRSLEWSLAFSTSDLSYDIRVAQLEAQTLHQCHSWVRIPV